MAHALRPDVRESDREDRGILDQNDGREAKNSLLSVADPEAVANELADPIRRDGVVLGVDQADDRVRAHRRVGAVEEHGLQAALEELGPERRAPVRCIARRRILRAPVDRIAQRERRVKDGALPILSNQAAHEHKSSKTKRRRKRETRLVLLQEPCERVEDAEQLRRERSLESFRGLLAGMLQKNALLLPVLRLVERRRELVVVLRGEERHILGCHSSLQEKRQQASGKQKTNRKIFACNYLEGGILEEGVLTGLCLMLAHCHACRRLFDFAWLFSFF